MGLSLEDIMSTFAILLIIAVILIILISNVSAFDTRSLLKSHVMSSYENCDSYSCVLLDLESKEQIFEEKYENSEHIIIISNKDNEIEDTLYFSKGLDSSDVSFDQLNSIKNSCDLQGSCLAFDVFLYDDNLNYYKIIIT